MPEGTAEAARMLASSACFLTNAAPASTAHGTSGAKQKAEEEVAREEVRAEVSGHHARPATIAATIPSVLHKLIPARHRIPRRRASVMMDGIMVTQRTHAQIRLTPIATSARTARVPIRPTWPIAIITIR